MKKWAKLPEYLLGPDPLVKRLGEGLVRFAQSESGAEGGWRLGEERRQAVADRRRIARGIAQDLLAANSRLSALELGRRIQKLEPELGSIRTLRRYLRRS